MYHHTIDLMEVQRCLLCHDAPCISVCPRADPARILRAIRFQNDQGGAPAAAGAISPAGTGATRPCASIRKSAGRCSFRTAVRDAICACWCARGGTSAGADAGRRQSVESITVNLASTSNDF